MFLTHSFSGSRAIKINNFTRETKLNITSNKIHISQFNLSQRFFARAKPLTPNTEPTKTPEELQKEFDEWKKIPRPEPLDLKKIVEEVDEKMKNPEKYRKKPDPELDVIISDASFIFTKYLQNPTSTDFSHVRIKLPETTFKAITAPEGFNITESVTHKMDHWYLGQEPWIYWKQHDVAKIEKGMGIVTVVDPQMVETASDAQKKRMDS